MADRFAHFVAYSAIALAIKFWPSIEPITACAAYVVLAAISACGLLFEWYAKRKSQIEARKDLREGLPYWPRPQV